MFVFIFKKKRAAGSIRGKNLKTVTLGARFLFCKYFDPTAVEIGSGLEARQRSKETG